tara:strand:- start:892 stop:1443 length:552 start_codon:yes stop_codon:yes gene_type:complete
MENSQLSRYLRRLVPDDFDLKEVNGNPNSIIIREGDGLILFPEEGNRKFKIRIYNCVSNELKFEENIVIPWYRIGSYGYLYCSSIYGSFIVDGKRGVFYCHSGSYTRAENLLKNVLEHYGNFDTMSFNYIPTNNIDSNDLYEKIDILKNRFDEVLKNVKDRVKYYISSNNSLSFDNFHVPLSI